MARHKKDINEAFSQPFAVNLRTLMEREPKTSQTELAQAIGKSRQVISQYCTGISEPPYEILVKIAKYFNVSLDYLLGITEDKKLVPSVIDDLGISDKTVKMFERLKAAYYLDVNIDYNSILEDFAFTTLMYAIMDYVAALKAGKIYRATLQSFFDITLDYDALLNIVESKAWDIDGFRNEIDKQIAKDSLPANVKRELVALRNLFDIQSDLDIVLSIFQDTSERTSVHGYAASRNLTKLLSNIKTIAETEE